MKTIIETDKDSVVLLSRESYDMMRAMMTASNLRNAELAKMRDRFEARVMKDKDAAHGYTKYYTADDVLTLFHEVFEIEPHEPEPADEPALNGGDEDNTEEGE